jgi:hypothetical protein
MPSGYIHPANRQPIYRPYRSPIPAAHVTLSVSDDDDPPIRVMLMYYKYDYRNNINLPR